MQVGASVRRADWKMRLGEEDTRMVSYTQYRIFFFSKEDDRKIFPREIFFFSKDWYKGQLTDEELDALENPPPKPKPSSGGQHRRKGAKPT